MVLGPGFQRPGSTFLEAGKKPVKQLAEVRLRVPAIESSSTNQNGG